MQRDSAAPDEVFALLVADVFDAAGALRRYGENIAATAGQTQARWQLMSVVSEGDWTVPMAADRLGTSRQAVQRVANELVSDNLAQFRDNPHHRRSPFLHLTASGARALSTITDHARRWHGWVERDLAGIDTAVLQRELRRLTAVVREHIDPTTGDGQSPA
jgi:DNA-binding MarR family transcriptional regulator